MLETRRSGDRGHYKNGWLNSRHTFSFGEYYDPEHMGVSVLRVINEDRVAPGAGFPTHPHREMEIVSYVLGGELEHRDSMGNGSVIRPGDVQRMSAGTGVTHSEFNPSKDHPTHFLQIWLLPSRKGVVPGYEQKHFAADAQQDLLQLLVSPNGRDGSIQVNSDASIYRARPGNGRAATYRIGEGRMSYVHVARGAATVEGESLGAGDAVAIRNHEVIGITGVDDAEVLVFDLPAK